MFNSKQSNCPNCGISWDGGGILESWKKLRDDGVAYIGKSDQELEKDMKECYSPPYRWRKLIGIEVQGNYDGISYWQCPNCKATWDRFSGEKVQL